MACPFRLYGQQQRQHGSSTPSSKAADGDPPRPNWLTVQNSQRLGSVLVVMIPYLDAELLRIYAGSKHPIVEAPSQLSIQKLEEFFGADGEAPSSCGRRSILKAAAGTKIPVRPPQVASPPYCSLVQNFFSIATTPTTFRGIPIGSCAHTPGIVCLTHYMLTPAELHARGFPGFENGTDPQVPHGYITLHGLQGAGESEHPRRSLLYGVDCEMVDTASGKELGRVCVVDSNCEVILDELVKPSGPVVDYLTQFSGLTKEILDKATLSLEDVHELLKSKLQSGAILVGHSLEYDLRALRVVHRRCIDTTVLYPHNREGLMLSLKKLAQLYLKKTMKRVCGHDPREDAQAAMLLTLKKIENGPGFAVPMTQLGPFASAMRKQQRDPCEEAAAQCSKPMEKKLAAVTARSSSEQTEAGCMFLVDSFKYTFTSALQDVTVADGLPDDSAVVRVCKDFLKSEGLAKKKTQSAGGSASPLGAACGSVGERSDGRPRWGVCVLRAYQRLCCHALQSPTDRLYAFNHWPRKLLAAEAQLRLKLEGENGVSPTSLSTSSTSNPVDDSNSQNGAGVSDELKDDVYCENHLVRNSAHVCLLRADDGKGFIREAKALFPSVSVAAAMQVISRIDRLLGDLAASLKPEDVIILLSPCGDAYRYFSLRFLQSALQGGESAEGKTREVNAGSFIRCSNNPAVTLVPLEWTSEFEREFEKAKAAFEGPTKGGWCSFIQPP
ncbi:hypothetical protein Efla_005896 [Eimeria flavescens]